MKTEYTLGPLLSQFLKFHKEDRKTIKKPVGTKLTFTQAQYHLVVSLSSDFLEEYLFPAQPAISWA
ncbi:hypothetical protein HY407_02660 [Candidatus Gottesmanbacteria bacterium]|nr:hypothetical protein [Candidatus Gottesmanbacteria bacterium]